MCTCTRRCCYAAVSVQRLRCFAGPLGPLLPQIFLYASTACLTASFCFPSQMQHASVSMVPTGPPQQGKNGFRKPGASAPTLSSAVFLICAFIASGDMAPSADMAEQTGLVPLCALGEPHTTLSETWQPEQKQLRRSRRTLAQVHQRLPRHVRVC